MATNRELRDEIASLSAQLGEDVSTDGLNNAKLSDLLAQLRVKAVGMHGGARRVEPEAVPSEPRAPQVPSVPTDDPAPGTPGEASPDGPPEGSSQPPDAPPAPPTSKAGVFKVAPGKDLVTFKGVRPAGTVVSPREFGDGENTMRELFEKGFLVKD
jgi:hypothetical protein